MTRWHKGILIVCLAISVLLLVSTSTSRVDHPVVTAKTNKPLDRTTTSTITSRTDEHGEIIITTTNRRFTFLEDYEYDGSLTMMLHEEFRRDQVPGLMGMPAFVTVEGWVGRFPNPQRKIWTFHSEGDEGKADYDVYKVTRYGCCDSKETQVWFSLIDGQKILTSNINPIKVEAPNIEGVLTRYVAWHSVEASIQPKERETMQGIQGILQYCSDRRVLQRLILRSGAGEPSKMAFRYQGKLYGDNQGTSYGLGLGNVNGRKGKMALSGFSIVLTLRDQSEIEIPVENDELQIAKAKGPTTINWEAAK